MSDQTPNPDDKNEVLDELRSLGENITNLLRNAWESDERKRLQQELETGFTDLRNSLGDLANSPTGQSIRQDIEGLGERIRAGEVEHAVRNEVLTALRMANDGLKKAAQRQTQNQGPAGPADRDAADSSDQESAGS